MPGPIPPLSEPPDWARLPIVECGEPLVPLTDEDASHRILFRAQYVLDGIPGAPETIWVRSGVRDRLRRAAGLLPPRLVLTVFDGHRPLIVQKYLYDAYEAQLRRERPELSGDELLMAVRQFVAAPNPDPACPPPHRTGGAVDVYLTDAETGEALAMGTAPDETRPASLTRYFEEQPAEPFTTNRRLLFFAMTWAGFTNYRGEWWHYDYGNQRWANCCGAAHAIYGIAEEVR